MAENKIKAYLGFALRARKLVLGVNAVKAVRGPVYLLLVDNSASANTKKEIESLKRRFSCPLIMVDNLDELTNKDFCKLAAMRDENLARAVLSVTGCEQISGEGTENGL